MEFFSTTKYKRPRRLSEITRKFAYDSLNRKYGLDTIAVSSIHLDDVENYDTLTDLKKYDLAIRKIVTECPIRICEGERISCAATLGLAIHHFVPATKNNQPIFQSISHLTIDYETVLKRGLIGLREDVNLSKATQNEPYKIEFLNSCIQSLDSFEIWLERYKDALKDKPEYKSNYKNLCKVPIYPAKNFYEAVQSIWCVFAFCRLCGNWPGIGRIDILLGNYLKKDLNDGTITLDEAREILAHFWIKGCEWITGEPCQSGDAQHYQNVLICGIDESGNDVTNEVSYLVLDIVEELSISDYPVSVRINSKTDEALLRRVAEVIRYGGGTIAIYNEETVIQALTGYGYDWKEAVKFANDGCWELQIPGKTFFIYRPFDSLYTLQNKVLKRYEEKLSYDTFDDLYSAMIKGMQEDLNVLLLDRLQLFKGPEGTKEAFVWKPARPCTVISLFEQGCIQKGLSYLEGGPIYNVFAPHIGGFADALNSLYAIKKLVYEEKKISLQDFMSVLKNNWEGNETLRQYALNKYQYYGNDNEEVDQLGARLLNDYAELCLALNCRCGYHFPAGMSTFGRQLAWAKVRLASPHGHKVGEVLAPNSSPTPGTDLEGASAIVKSFCNLRLEKMASGSAVDLKILPSLIDGEQGLTAMVSLFRGMVTLGGMFIQPDIASAELLKAAQKDPEKYKTLSVRVSGWNARFVTLSENWQNMIIQDHEK